MSIENRSRRSPRRAQEEAFGERTEGLGQLIPQNSLFHLIFLCAFFHFALCHLDRHDVNFVLGGILMDFELYLMPFMALQGLWVAHRPALVVLVDERLAIGAVILPDRLTAFADAFSAFMVSCFISPGLVASCASASNDITSASAKQINISFFIRELLSERTTLGGTPLMCGSCVPLRPRVTPKTWFSG